MVFASSEDLRHDGGGDIGGRVHVREVGVHVFGGHEQPNKAGLNRQPEQLGRPQRQISSDAILNKEFGILVRRISSCMASVKIGSKSDFLEKKKLRENSVVQFLLTF